MRETQSQTIPVMRKSHQRREASSASSYSSRRRSFTATSLVERERGMAGGRFYTEACIPSSGVPRATRP